MTTLPNSLGLSSLYAVVAAHFDLFFFFFFFWKLQFSFFRRAAGTTKGIFARPSKLIASELMYWLLLLWCPAAGKGNTAPFLYRSYALFILQMDLKVSLVWCWTGADWTTTKISIFHLGLEQKSTFFFFFFCASKLQTLLIRRFILFKSEF